MEYIIGGIIAAAAFFIFSAKRKVDDFNKMCLLNFPAWQSVFLSSNTPVKVGMARALLMQSLHLAENTGAITPTLKRELESELKSHDPVETVDGWLDVALPHVLDVCGEQYLTEIDARLVGVFMLVCLSGVNPKNDLTRYLEKLNY